MASRDRAEPGSVPARAKWMLREHKDSKAFSISAGFLQFDVRLGDPDGNLATLRRMLADLAPTGPCLIVLPELWACGFDYEHLAAHAAAGPHLLAALHDEARRFGIHLAGSIPEAGDPPGPIYNSLFIVGPKGVCGRYRKQRLFAPMAEDLHFSPGDRPQSIETELGAIAALVCYDLRFPELAASQAGQGARLIAVSAQWPAVRAAHWRALLIARAIENQLFVVACNRSGIGSGTEYAGHSLIIGPDGAVLVEAGGGEEAAMTPLDPELPRGLRRRFNTVGPRPYPFHDRDKIVTLEKLVLQVEGYRAAGRRLVFTNGCFDILHEGHVTYLEEARRLGDCLIVGINSDRSVRSLGKGSDRPVNPETSRARLLAALGCVDHVVIFDEATPIRLIKALLPELLVKGGDWPVESIVGAPEVLAAGGKVLSIPLVGGHSTTGLLKKIRQG